jgi:endoglucanase
MARGRGRIGARAALATLFLALFAIIGPARAAPPPRRIAVLARGVNITGWFRFPTSRDPTALRTWLSDPAIADLRAAGFTFVRLAVDPDVVAPAPARLALIAAIRRLQRRGLGVVVSPHPVHWALDTKESDRTRLIAFWRALAPLLRPLPLDLTFPETLNEPVFRDDPAAWWRLRRRLLAVIRAALPAATIIVTGPDWDSIDGLLSTPPEADTDLVYSFHFYDPGELTALAAYRHDLDRAALRRLPFPAHDPADCEAAAAARDSTTRGFVHFYCAMHWDAAHVRARLARAAAWARARGVALLAGEFGASAALNAKARLAWLRLVRETCAADQIGWALWGYDDVMGLNVARPPKRRPGLDPAVLAALGLSSPRPDQDAGGAEAVAGAPGGHEESLSQIR